MRNLYLSRLQKQIAPASKEESARFGIASKRVYLDQLVMGLWHDFGRIISYQMERG